MPVMGLAIRYAIGGYLVFTTLWGMLRPPALPTPRPIANLIRLQQWLRLVIGIGMFLPLSWRWVSPVQIVGLVLLVSLVFVSVRRSRLLREASQPE